MYYTDGTNQNLGSVAGSSGEEEIDISCLEFTLQADDTYAVSVKDSCKTTVESITIPSQYNGKSVTAIVERGFYGCTALKEINIPNSITTIGECAFENCTAINNVELPSMLTEIDSALFRGCSSLTNVTVPKSVKSVGFQAFYGCSLLKQLEFPVEGLEEISYAAFMGSNIAELTIPKTVIYIGRNAFAGSQITDVHFLDPNGWSKGNEAQGWAFTSVSSTSLSNSKTAAEILKNQGPSNWGYEFKKS